LGLVPREMMMTKTIEELLQEPLDPKHVSKRKNFGGGGSLSYIEGHHAIREANRIFGPLGWDRSTVEMHCVQQEQDAKGNWRVTYTAKSVIRVGDGGSAFRCAVREGWGTGQGINKDLGMAHEGACKEAETDAMKRALMTFGDPLGLALYDKKQTNVRANDAPPPEDVAKRVLEIEEKVKACKSASNLQSLFKELDRETRKAAKPIFEKRQSELGGG
jgi:DNA recombination protein Rad52